MVKKMSCSADGTVVELVEGTSTSTTPRRKTPTKINIKEDDLTIEKVEDGDEEWDSDEEEEKYRRRKRMGNYAFASFMLLTVAALLLVLVTFNAPRGGGGSSTSTSTTDNNVASEEEGEDEWNFRVDMPRDVRRKAKDHPDRPIAYLDYHLSGQQGMSEKTFRVFVQLLPAASPNGVSNFAQLLIGDGPDYDATMVVRFMSRGLSYAGSRCHRIVKDFIIQCGDFTTGDGSGGFSVVGSNKVSGFFTDDPGGLLLKHHRYTLQYGNYGQPNTSGSQFCIMLKSTPWLDGKHIVFGRVVGEASKLNVDKIENRTATEDGLTPLEEVTISGGISYPAEFLQPLMEYAGL